MQNTPNVLAYSVTTN